MARSSDLQTFLDRSSDALSRATAGRAATAARRAEAIWQGTAGPPGDGKAARLPVCDWLAPALAAAAGGPRAGLAASFGALVPRLAWRPRSSADPADAAYWNGHANAMILGPGGLEERSDLWIGATVMAPGVLYPDHDHPPEEVYLSLSPGEWWNAEMNWTDPGPDGAIYNPPGIRHRMRAGVEPFLALWYLPA